MSQPRFDGLLGAAGRWLVRVLAVATLALPLAAAADDKAEAYFKDATEYLAKGEIKSAVIQLKNALQRDPGHVGARLMLGRLYLATGDGPGAEKEFSRAGELGAKAADWLSGYGQALLLQHRPQEVLDKVSIPDQAQPSVRASLLALRGQASLAIGDTEQAREAFDDALALDGANLQARLGQIRLLARQDKTEDALVRARELSEAHPDNFVLQLITGDLYRRVGQLDEAENAFQRARQLAPGDPRGHVGLALVHLMQDKLDDAVADAERMRQQFHDRVPMASYVHAVAAYRKGDLNTAGDQLQKVLSVAPDLIQAQMLYGVINYSQGKLEIAEDYLARVNAQLPDDGLVARLLAATYLKLKRPEAALEVLVPIEKTGANDAQLFALLGTAYLQTGESAKSADYMAKAVELAPDQALLRTQLAVGRLASGDTSSAVAELEKAIDLGQDVIQADVLLVLSHIRSNEPDKAIAVAKRLQSRMPDSPIPPNLLGLSQLAARDYPSARASFRQALRNDPDFYVGYLNLARTELLDDQPEAAAKELAALLDKKPGHVGAMLGLAGLAKQRGDAAGYEEWITKAYNTKPDSPQSAVPMAGLLIAKNEPLKAFSVLNGLPKAAAQDPAVLYARGLAQLQARDFSNAARSFRKLVDKQSNNGEGWFQLGRAQAAAGDVAGARESFDRAIALDKDMSTPLAVMAKGELEIKEKQWDAALKIAATLIERFPKSPAGFELRAAAYRGKGDITESLQALEQAVNIDGTVSRTNVYAFDLAANGQVDRAIEVLQDWLDRHPDDPVTRGNLGLIQQKAGHADSAMKSFELAVAHGSKSPAVLNNLAWLYYEHGDHRAIDTARKAYDLASQRPEIVDTYGWLLFNAGQEKTGMQLLQQALVLAPHNPEIALHVAEALHRSGRDQEAIPLVERIIKDRTSPKWVERAKDLRAKLSGG